MRSATDAPANPIRVRRSKTSTSPSFEPRTSASPVVGYRAAPMICRRVVLPAPLAPMTTHRSPGSTRHDTSESRNLPGRTTLTWDRSKAADMIPKRSRCSSLRSSTLARWQPLHQRTAASLAAGSLRAMTEHVPSPHLSGPTVLLTFTGPDRPGVSTALFDRLSAFAVEVVDVEQLVVRGRLILSVLLTQPDDVEALETAARDLAGDLGFVVEIERGSGDNRPRRVGRMIITVLGHPLEPAAMAAVTHQIAAVGGNIDRILRLARYPVTALRLEVSGADADHLQGLMLQVASDHAVDIAVAEHGIMRHAQRLVVIAVDSSLIQGEVIEMLAEHA